MLILKKCRDFADSPVNSLAQHSECKPPRRNRPTDRSVARRSARPHRSLARPRRDQRLPISRISHLPSELRTCGASCYAKRSAVGFPVTTRLHAGRRYPECPSRPSISPRNRRADTRQGLSGRCSCGAERPPPPLLRFGNPRSAFHGLGAGR